MKYPQMIDENGAEISKISKFRRPAIYGIECQTTFKIYIGSALDLYSRWYNHILELDQGRHFNPILQRAWNKYGRDNFLFKIIEPVADKNLLIEKEQYWLDTLKPYERDKGYNILTKARSGLGRKMPKEFSEQLRKRFSKEWSGFINPQGEIVPPFTNLNEFCRQNDLAQSAMSSMAKGKKWTVMHKGWTHVNAKRMEKDYKVYEGFINPEGELIPPIIGLYAFCKEHDLYAPTIHDLSMGKPGAKQHRGWTHVNALKPSKAGKEILRVLQKCETVESALLSVEILPSTELKSIPALNSVLASLISRKLVEKGPKKSVPYTTPQGKSCPQMRATWYITALGKKAIEE